MVTTLEDPERRIVPRWRPWREALELGDLDAAKEIRIPQVIDRSEVERIRAEWKASGTLPFATDLLGAVIVAGKPYNAREAAEFVLAARASASRAAKSLATMLLADESGPKTVREDPRVVEKTERWARVRILRASLRSHPNNPLAYLDLAREYVSLGQRESALRPVRTAVALSPNSRFVLRSAARFFLHAEDPEMAHRILRRAGRTTRDPWVLAAEIVVADSIGRRSSNIKLAEDMATSGDFSPRNISELAGALGTLYWLDGNSRRAKRLFKHALRMPTENTVAQAGWISRRAGFPD